MPVGCTDVVVAAASGNDVVVDVESIDVVGGCDDAMVNGAVVVGKGSVATAEFVGSGTVTVSAGTAEPLVLAAVVVEVAGVD